MSDWFYKHEYKLLSNYLVEFELTFFRTYDRIQLQSFYDKYSLFIQIVMNVREINYRTAYLCYERVSFYIEKLSW